VNISSLISTSNAMRTTLAFALLLPGAALAASPVPGGSPRAVPERLEELSEVTVSGEKPTRKVGDLIPWIRRLLGQYAFNGYVDLVGKGDSGDRRQVYGIGTCVGFGVAPGVQCEIDVRWRATTQSVGEEVPGRVSALVPAMILYGVEPDELGIRYLQVDSRGLAEGATGFVIGDTATFRAPCVDIPDGCLRITRITAPADSKLIEMQVDTEVNAEVVLRYHFALTRVAEIQSPAGAKP
jgi:hypothetical protein